MNESEFYALLEKNYSHGLEALTFSLDEGVLIVLTGESVEMRSLVEAIDSEEVYLTGTFDVALFRGIEELVKLVSKRGTIPVKLRFWNGRRLVGNEAKATISSEALN